ncbi:MAG: hypothetical protein JXQ75_04685 [Phycisphaerae bacterium]|nr:hypothetical protein [Phycisphaerae bacterium]
MDRKRIIERALGLIQAVSRYAERARLFFYTVVLAEYRCPACGGRLAMRCEGLCSCTSCGREFDPTIAFQACSACGGQPRLQVRRYVCARCGTEVASRFLFDGLVFDASYFRQRMAEFRQRRRDLRERVRTMLADSRSDVVHPPAADLGSVPGLLTALDALTSMHDATSTLDSRQRFDLARYEKHVQAHLGALPVSMGEIPPLSEDVRMDRIGRFIAIIFLAHAGLIDIWQAGPEIMVMKRETDREGQELPGEPPEADGIEGPLGGAEA